MKLVQYVSFCIISIVDLGLLLITELLFEQLPMIRKLWSIDFLII